MKIVYTLLAIAGGCLILGALQCLLSAIRPTRPSVPWYRSHGEGGP